MIYTEYTEVSIEAQWGLMISIMMGVIGIFLIIFLIIHNSNEKNRIKEAEFQKNYKIEDAKRRDERIKLTTCPKCKEYGSHGLDYESKKYDQKTDTVTIWRECHSCGYKQFENQPTVSNFVEALDNQFKEWENNGVKNENN